MEKGGEARQLAHGRPAPLRSDHDPRSARSLWSDLDVHDGRNTHQDLLRPRPKPAPAPRPPCFSRHRAARSRASCARVSQACPATRHRTASGSCRASASSAMTPWPPSRITRKVKASSARLATASMRAARCASRRAEATENGPRLRQILRSTRTTAGRCVLTRATAVRASDASATTRRSPAASAYRRTASPHPPDPATRTTVIAPLGNEPRGLETPVPPPEEALSLAGRALRNSFVCRSRAIRRAIPSPDCATLTRAIRRAVKVALSLRRRLPPGFKSTDGAASISAPKPHISGAGP